MTIILFMNWIIIVAGGNGSRMKNHQNKVFLPLAGKPIIYHTLKIFENLSLIDHILITAKAKDIPQLEEIIKDSNFQKVAKIIEVSSTERQENTWQAIKYLKTLKIKDDDLIGVHNAVNPLVTREEVKQVFTAAKEKGSALLAMPAKDTVKIVDKHNFVDYSPDRNFVYYAQTPQVAQFSIIYKAFAQAEADNHWGTDDTSLIERIGKQVKVVPCSADNFKITYPIDLLTAQQIMKNK